MKYTFGNHTDVGKVRTQNEDYYGSWENENGHLFVVCDGMGGHVGGAIASRIAVESIQTYFLHNKAENPIIAIQKALEYANTCIWQRKVEQPELSGMGTTAVIVLIKNEKVFYAHVGDSRIYLFTEGKLKRLTKDHSLVQSLVDSGNITEEEAERHPNRNQIYKALGIDVCVEPTVCIAPVAPKKGDCFLLCTDGLSGLVNDEVIKKTISAEGSVQQKAFNLIELANHNGGSDNITAQLISFEEPEQKWKIRPLWIVIATSMVLFGVIASVLLVVRSGKNHNNTTRKFGVSNDTSKKVTDTIKSIAKFTAVKDSTIKIKYTIKEGDDEDVLEEKFGYSWHEILTDNPGNTTIGPLKGKVILVRIQAKDTLPKEVALTDFLDDLAKKYHISKDQIVRTNEINLKKKNRQLKEIIIPIKK